MGGSAPNADISHMTPHTPRRSSSRGRTLLALAAAATLVTGFAPAALAAPTPSFGTSQLRIATVYNADGVALSAPTVTVNGTTVTYSATVQTRKATTFKHLLIHVPGHDTGFNDGRTVRGNYTVTGSKQMPAGTYQAVVAYQIGTSAWVHGPATTFTVAAPTEPAPTTPSAPTPTPFTVTSTTTATGATLTSTSTTLNPATLAAMDASVRPTQVGGLWTSIGRSPSLSEVQQAATRYDVFVLNAWDTAQLREIKRVNPNATVLVYKCLSSARNYSGAVVNGQDAAKLPSGIGYVQASAHPEWFAATTTGGRIEWNGYPLHWQMAVWDAGYQQAWTRSVTDEVVREGWDGVLADNDFAHLKYYSPALLAGTTSADATDQKLRNGLDSLVAMSGADLNKNGKILVPNLSDGRLDLPRWQRTAGYGGIMEENFTHWGTSTTDGYVSDWGTTGWIDQTAQLASPLTLTVTRAQPGDSRTLRYSYSSALVRAQGRVAWTASTTGVYDVQEWFPWQGIEVGNALTTGTRVNGGAWVRTFENAYVVVNPTNSPVTVPVPAGFSKSSVQVPALDGAIVTR